MPPYPSTHHCSCGRSTKRAAKLGYCPKCSETCEGRGSAQTKGGVAQVITHKKWVKYQTESCSACENAREAIEKITYTIPPYPSTHHCSCDKPTKRAAKLGYCPKCSETCEGRGSAQTKGGVAQAITHKKWVKYQTESCSACESAREAIEKKK
ncbi:hypothetical protein CY34DRAFT_812907 [Suillus luteus UH-Slu-Lm8-n1]|uniref:Uncharacterized protein n=1 Tax=Suillus luteus UH-Slu-Lm8-n1 TaxID=930992 RepID=A0A0D0A8J3_9AGAM|nr:hypothetical protein CY34DRAFT_812907 [Suillus luteus UH-Slu-Lm8-n1]